MNKHWNKVYEAEHTDHSWHQLCPESVLFLLKALKLNKDAAIIDVGGGDSNLVDHLLEMGYTNISVLDISNKAIERAKKRLGKNAVKVKWIVADMLQFVTDVKYDLWVDRAAFHFLVEPSQVLEYKHRTERFISQNGNLIVGTFSKEGPDSCSGLPVRPYNKDELTQVFEGSYDRAKCIYENHITPNGQLQNFIYCLFKRRIGKEISHVTEEDLVMKSTIYDHLTIANSCSIDNKGCCCK